jgi:Na+/citrate or Na+/malate symporter
MRDVSDQQLWRIVVKGSIVGMIGLFAVGMVIGLAAGLSAGTAAAVAVLPTIFGGWFYGGTAFLLRAAFGAAKPEPRDADKPGERPVEHPDRQAA